MKIDQLLTIFNLRDIEAVAYKTLLTSGVLSASEIARQMNVSRTSVYDLLKTLIQKGLVYETLKGGVKKFAPQPSEKINLLLQEKEKSISQAKKILENFNLEYQNASQLFGPRLQVFEGRESLQQMMKDILLYRDITVRAYWPVKHIIQLLTPQFWQKYQKERVARNIELKVIWPQEQMPDFNKFPYLKSSQELKREARVAPKGVNFSLGYGIYGNTVRFISSAKESFGYLIESAELAEMMTGQFDLIWQQSKPIK
jgi:HTH-type transcriptional regulator, sugar sensing transcriptional regulator